MLFDAREEVCEFAPYCASKAAVISLTQAGARELARHKITVNGFAPGVVATPLWDDLEDTMIDEGKIKARGEFLLGLTPEGKPCLLL